MTPYQQGFLDKFAEAGISAGDVAKFVIPIILAGGIGATIGAPVGLFKKDTTITEGALDGALVGAGAGLTRQILKRLNLAKKITRGFSDKD